MKKSKNIYFSLLKQNKSLNKAKIIKKNTHENKKIQFKKNILNNIQ